MVVHKMNEIKAGFVPGHDNIVSSVAQIEGAARSLWGGYFGNSRTALSEKILFSIAYDKRLYSVAIESLKAQTRMFSKRNIVPEHAAKQIIKALDQLKKEIIAQKVIITDDVRDIYTFIETYLEGMIGDSTHYLKIARSKHEQYTGDLRLWMRDACDVLDTVIQNLQAALIEKAEENVKTTIPSYINNQVGPPISLAHQLLFYVEMFGRDRIRLRETRQRINKSPFGANKGVGTAFHISREMTSKILGFDSIIPNAMDAVVDRDFVVDFVSASSISMMHLSKVTEDLLLWQSPGCSFISFSPDLAVQDQIVPNKHYPEILEIVRGKVGRVYGDLFAILTVLKSLNSMTQDMQAVVEPVFDAYDTMFNCVNIMSALIADFTVRRKEFKEAAQYGYSIAFDLLDWLISSIDMPYEQAAFITRQIIDYAMQKNKKLSLLELSELQEIEPRITDGIYSVLIPSRAVISRRSVGGTNPVKVRKSIRVARREYI